MAERNINTTLKKRLINNEPFIYAHLIKYERPSTTTVHAKHSTDAVRYAYLTDGPIDITFDDGSYATDGTTANGNQLYIADKILQVGNYQETNQAKATGMTLKLAANSINNSVTGTNFIIAPSEKAIDIDGASPLIDLVKEGFRVGDKITISSTGSSVSNEANNGKEVRIARIRNVGTKANCRIIYEDIDTLVTQADGTVTLTIDSDELKGPLVERNDSGTLKSYHNRDVFVYKAFLDPDDYSIIGAPVLVFKGIIASSSIIDNPSKDIEVQWKLTSHWGDFYAVNGRMTNDAVHRALDNNGIPDPKMALKEIYAGDLGFMHAETTVNILATYIAIEKEPELKKKKKFFGLIKKYDMVWKDVEVERTTDLNWALEAKYLPVVYGIDRLAGIPIFVDTLNGNANKIYMVHALSEGEIGGIYDLYIDDNPLICQTEEDADARTSSSEGVDVVCRGRADRGTVLAGKVISGPNADTPTDEEDLDVILQYSPGRHDRIPMRIKKYYERVLSQASGSVTSINSKGVIHEETIKITAPNEMYFDVHTGKTEQRANNTLVQIADGTDKFKRQTDYWGDNLHDYWGSNHTLADTAYVVMECTIAEDADTVPDIEYVVKGKFLESYNYDFSYVHNPLSTYGSEVVGSFKVGDTVDLKRTDTNAVINDDVYIIDKWTMVGPDGVVETRFRFSDAPNLGYSGGVPAITNFYMYNGSQEWHMITYNHVFESGTAGTATKASATIGSSSNVPTVTFSSGPDWVREGGTNNTFPNFDNHAGYLPIRIIDSGQTYTDTSFPIAITSATVLTMTGATANKLVTGTKDVIRTDTIRLASSTNVVDNFYNGMTVELTIKDVSNNWTKHTRKIIDYDQSTDLAQVDRPWDAGFEPDLDDDSTYTYKILSPGDRRVSVNPTIQLLDYTTSSTYGMRLDIEDDISLADWTLAARTCDAKGTQTITVKANSVDTADGDMYVLTSDGSNSGDIIAMGQVVNHGAEGDTTIELQECYNKFSKDYMKNRHSYLVGDIVNDSTGYFRVTAAGTKAKGPTESGATGYSSVITADGYPIYKLSQSSGATTIEATTGKLFAVKTDTQGSTTYESAVDYSLYNSDFVKYWRYLGWEDHQQRWATRHQFCGVLDTATSVFDNVNSFLKQMNGMLSYENGKYVLRIATTSTAIASDIEDSSGTGYNIGSEKNIRYITNDDIIGNISLTDPGPKKSFNTMTSTIADPGSRFKGKQVSFFDSNYLKTDKNVIKSGTHSQPAVASYFNARINVENALRKSRFGMKISFTLGPKALLLLAGETIAITHDKFDWTAKKFRLTNITYNLDCTARISAEEYDDSFYTISTPKLASVLNDDITQPIPPVIGAPTALSAVSDTVGTIDLSWTSGSQSTSANNTEIWIATSNDRTTAKLKTTIPDNPDFNDGTNDPAGNRLVKWTDTIGYDGRAKYYWIRHKWTNKLGRVKYSSYFPSSATGGVTATSVLAEVYRNVTLQANKQVFTSLNGSIESSTITITPTITGLDNNITWTTTGDDDSNIPLYDAAEDGNTTTSGRVAVYLRHGNIGDNTSISVIATIVENSVTYSETITFPLIASNTASSAKTVRLRSSGLVFLDDNTATSTTPDSPPYITLTAVKQNTTATANWAVTEDSPSVSLRSGTSASSSIVTTGNTVYLHKADYAGNDSVVVTLTCDGIEDTTSIVRLSRNSGLVQAVLNNPSHVMQADDDGAVSNTQAAGSGTTIRVYSGQTALNFTTGTPAAGQWALAVNNGVLGGSGVSGNGTALATVAAHTGIVTGTDTYTIIYTISGKNLDGTDFTTFTTNQYLTKSKQGTPGTIGLSNAIVYLYKINNSNSTAPTLPDSGSSSYNFTSKALTETSSGDWDGWSNVLPDMTASNPYRWVTAATASSNSNTDTIPYSEWATAILDSAEGYQTATVYLYQRTSSATSPAVINDDSTYTFSNKTLTNSNTLDSWTQTIPTSGGDYIHATTAVALAINSATTDTIATGDWSTPTVLAQKGDQGDSGLNQTTISLYYLNNDSSSTPTLINNNLFWNFTEKKLVQSTGTTTTLSDGHASLDGWKQAFPATTDTLGVRWVTMAVASANSAEDTIASGDWSTPVVIGDDKSIKSHQVDLYQRDTDTTAPADPNNNLFWNFDNGHLVVSSGSTTNLVDGHASLDSWTQEIPATGDDYIFKISAMALGNASATEDTIEPGDWSDASLISVPGQGVKYASLYKLNDSTITTNNFGTFADPASGAESGWTIAVPDIGTTDGNIIYVTTRTFTSDGASPQTSTWTAPVVHSRYTKGETGRKVAELKMYRYHTFNNNTFALPSAPTSGTYNFSNSTVTSPNPNSWTQVKPAAAVGVFIIQSEALATESSTANVSNALSWSTPSVEGYPGNDVNFIFRRDTATNTPADTAYGATLPSSGGQWYDDIADVPAGSNSIWVSKGIVKWSESGGTYSYIWDWGASSQIEGSQGDPGDDGDNTAIITLYKRSSSGSSAPAVPDNNIVYTFADASISGSLDSWTTTVPSGAAQYLWTTTATAIGVNGATTGTIDANLISAGGDWATPTVQSEAQQPRTFTRAVFYDAWTSGTLSAPTSSGGFDWDDMELDGLSSGWSNSIATIPFAYCVYDATEDTYGGTTTVTFQPVDYLNEISLGVPTQYQNSSISISAGGTEGLLTLTQYSGATDTTTIDKTQLGLDYTDGATVGAKLGTNFLDASNNSLGNEDVRNSDLSLAYSGTNIQIKKGSNQIGSNLDAPSVLKNATIAIDGTTGVISGIGTADIKVNNAKQLYTDITDSKPPTDATKGAVFGTNMYDTNGSTNLTAAVVKNSSITLNAAGYLNNIGTTEKVKNALVEINTDGTLNYAGGGSGAVSKAGLSLDYDDGATVGAIAGTNLKAANGTTTLGDDDVKNSALDVRIDGTAIKLKIGSTETSTVTAGQGLVGLSGVANNASANGTTINSSGNITGNITVNSKMTISYSNEYILVED